MEAGERLAVDISEALKELHMPHAQLILQWRTRNSWDAWGTDDVDWLFSANPGSPPLPLHQVASGGERSRLMLAIKSVVEDGQGVPTIVLDEIDTGVSGQIAEKMARTMQRMAASRQVLAITHLPQVAAAGNQQWEVAKFVASGSTTTQLIPLTASSRVQAIARMLSGAEVGEAATQHAQSLLDALRSETPIQSH
jgi:DNA repair protein RecN (Recombination protein N)